jgi:transposase
MENGLTFIQDLLVKSFGIIGAKRIICVLLLLFGVDKKQIKERLGVSPITVDKYARLINEGKTQQIFADNHYRPRSEMEDYKEEIKAELDKNPPKSLREAAAAIERVSGLKRGIVQVSNFLKKTGIDY